MDVTFKVRRHEPRTGGKPSQQEYGVDVAPGATVFDALVQIR